MLTYFAIGIAVRPLLPSGYFLWLTKKSALFINDDVDPFRIKELPRDFETMDTAFDVTTIFTNQQTLWLPSNGQTFYIKYTTCNFFYYCQNVKMVSARFYCLYLQGYPQTLMIIFMLSNLISDVSTCVVKFILHLYWKIGILLWNTLFHISYA